MTTIFKYPFKTADAFTIEMLAAAEILCVQVQNNVPCMWAKVDTDMPVSKRKFEVFGTGHEIPYEYNGKYIGTYQQFNGQLVFHLFDIT